MSLGAIILMILAMIIIWGGLAVSVWFLASHPLPDEGDGGTRRPRGSRR